MQRESLLNANVANALNDDRRTDPSSTPLATALLDLSVRLLQSAEPHVLATDAIEFACRLLALQACALLTVNAYGALSVVASAGWTAPLPRELPLDEHNQAGYAVLRRTTVVVNDCAEPKPSPIHAEVRGYGFKSSLAAPFISSSQARGVMLAYASQPRDFPPAEVELFSAIANFTALALERVQQHQLLQFEEEKSAQLYRQLSHLAQDVSHLHRREEDVHRRLDSLYTVAEQLASSINLDEVLQVLASQVVTTIGVSFCRVSLLSPDQQRLTIRAAHAAHTMEWNAHLNGECALAETLWHRHAFTQSAPLIVREDELELTPYLEARLFTLGDAKTACLAVLRVEGKAVGVLSLGEMRSWERESFSDDRLKFIQAFADHGAIAVRRSQLFSELEGTYLSTITTLVNAIEARDAYTSGHAHRIAEMAMKVGHELGMGRAELEALRWGALLHDIGKLGIPDTILKKPAALTEVEWAIMKRHPELGAQIIAPVRRLSNVVPLVRYHQERYDGRGYPAGLARDEIPLGARVLAVADAFSAMTDDRVYRPKRSMAEAKAELLRNAGTQFDPRVVEAFLAVIG